MSLAWQDLSITFNYEHFGFKIIDYVKYRKNTSIALNFEKVRSYSDDDINFEI